MVIQCIKTKEIIAFNINAIDIKIHDDTAIVHYYYSFLEKNKNAEGGEKKINGRKTDVLIKEANKWVIIADHGGKMNNK